MCRCKMSPILPLLISGPCTRVPSEHLQATWTCELKVESINRYCMQLRISTRCFHTLLMVMQWINYCCETNLYLNCLHSMAKSYQAALKKQLQLNGSHSYDCMYNFIHVVAKWACSNFKIQWLWTPLPMDNVWAEFSRSILLLMGNGKFCDT